jgi:hypothetical protein
LGDGSWIVRGGALISAAGAFTLFAEWTFDAELGRRRQRIQDYLDRVVDQRNIAEIERDIELEAQKLRLPVVSISAALLAIGSILQAVGDFLQPVLSLAARAVKQLISTFHLA